MSGFSARCGQNLVLVALTRGAHIGPAGLLQEGSDHALSSCGIHHLAGLSRFTPRAHADDSVTLRLKWLNQAQFAGFYVAKEKGYYKAEGLDVNIQPGGPDFPAVQMVAGGNEQFGVTGADQILIARSKGVPVVALAVIYRRNPFVLFSLAKSGIKTPADYVGKKVGVKIGGNEELIYRAVLAKAGDRQIQADGNSGQIRHHAALNRHRRRLAGLSHQRGAGGEGKGIRRQHRLSRPTMASIFMPTRCSPPKRCSRKSRSVVRKFVAATLKGWNTAIASPEEAAKITVKYGDKLTYDHELAMMKASVPLLKPDSKPVGSMDEAGWSSAQKLLLAAGFQKAAGRRHQGLHDQVLTNERDRLDRSVGRARRSRRPSPSSRSPISTSASAAWSRSRA